MYHFEKKQANPRPCLIWKDRQVGEFLNKLGLTTYQDAMIRSMVENVRAYEQMKAGTITEDVVMKNETRCQ